MGEHLQRGLFEKEPKIPPSPETQNKKGIEIPRSPEDGLDFDCKYCEDREGGCAQCGWGHSKEKKATH